MEPRADLPSHPRRDRGARRSTVAGAIAVAALLLLLPSSPAAGQERGAGCATAPTASGRYVAFLYQEILRRCPDAGAARFWTARLEGGASRWSVAESIDTSTENLGRNNVDGWYAGLLGRPPTSAERVSWIAYLRNAHENALPTAVLLASPEGYDLHTSASTPTERDREWLTDAFNRILDRAPEPQEVDHHLGQLGAAGSTTATRIAVAMGLERSSSNAGSWVRAAMTEALGRPPDAGGVRSWTAWLTGSGRWQTFRLWTHLLSSDEAYRRAQDAPDA